MLLTAFISLFLNICLRSTEGSGVATGLSRLTTVPDYELFHEPCPDLARCVHFCVNHKACYKLMYPDTDSRCVGYLYGNQTTNPLNAGQVVMEIKRTIAIRDDLAKSTAGATCTSSTQQHTGQYPCVCALDSLLSTGASQEWLSAQEGPGSWIRVTLYGLSIVSHIKLWNRCHINAQTKGVMLHMDTGPGQPVSLPCDGGTLYSCSTDGHSFHLASTLTKTVRVETTATCVIPWENTGWRAIQISGVVI